MRRGTRVGEAYVALTADGSGLNDDIADQFEDVDFEGIADRQGEKYRTALRQHIEAVGGDLDKSIKGLGKRIEADSAIGQGLAKKLATSLDKGELDELFQRVGRQAGVSTGSEFSRVVKPAVLNAVEDAMRDASKRGTQIDLFGEVTKKAVADVQRSIEETTRAYEEGRKANAKITQQMVESTVRMREKANEAIAKSDAELVKEQQKILENARKAAIKADEDLWKIRRQTATAHIKYLADLERGRIDAMGNTVSRNKKSFDVGRLFGKGSRNNFLNLFGRSIGGITKMIQGATRASVGLFSTFATGFSQVAESASLLQKVGGGFAAVGARMGASFSKLAASGPAVVVAIVAVVAALSLMVSVMGALLGIVTALAATIAGALAAALAVTGGLLLTAAAAGGLLTAAFMNMTDAQKDMLKSAFKPLKTEMRGIAQLMLKDMVPAFASWSKHLQNALALLGPVASVMGTAFAQAGNILTSALSGPGFQKFFLMLRQELPDITTRMSSALGSFLNGLTGMFAAILPMVTRFAGYLAQVADRFSRWANSATGQNAIVSFVDRAVKSLLSLWNFVREFTGFIADVLFSPAAMNAGNSIFDSLARSFRSFRRNLDNGNLKKWFDDSVVFARGLGHAIRGVFKIFQLLYSSNIVQGLGRAMNFLGRAAAFCADMFGLANRGFRLGAGASKAMLAPLAALWGLLRSVAGVARDALDWLRAFSSLPTSIPFVGALDGLIGKLDTVARYTGAALAGLQALAGAERDVRLQRASSGSGLTIGPQTTFSPTPGGMYDTQYQNLLSSLGSMGSYSGGGGGGGGGGSAGGGGGPAQWHNPYVAYANSLIKQGPGLVRQIQMAIRKVNNDIRKGIRAVGRAENAGIARETLNAMIANARDAGRATVQTARDAINDAARNLASASSQGEANRALKQIERAQRAMGLALANQRRIQRAINMLARQKMVRGWSVNRLMRGIIPAHATLAEIAEARRRVTLRIERANQQLADAIALRDDYQKTITDAVQNFGSLMTAQAKTVDGVEQALTAGDITENLSSRLEKIRKFQNDLKLLIAQGLSNEAYKQLVDAGVDEGGRFAEALLGGGIGSITEVNNLVSQIDGIAAQLGSETSTRLYQAGVDAARGLVDGLNSLAAQLDAAAARLGDRIARSIAKALGIRSPSKRLDDLMDPAGDGMVNGLDRQHAKVGAAAARLADQIAVSPEVAAHAARQGTSATTDPSDVSGNGKQFVWNGDINTPTEDPMAVAHEVVNEITGRL